MRSGDRALVFAPAGEQRLPLVVLVHGSHVHPRHYRRYASLLAEQGFVVVAPEHVREFMGSTAHYPQQAFVNWGLDWAREEDVRPGSPLQGRIDTATLFVVGHSMGGGTTLGICADVDQPGLVVDTWSRPPELVAVAVAGTHNIPPPRTGEPIPVDNKVPVAFLQGSSDGTVTKDQAERTFAALHGVEPRLWVELAGASHYFLTDDDEPEGSNPDRNGPATLDHEPPRRAPRSTGPPPGSGRTSATRTRSPRAAPRARSRRAVPHRAPRRRLASRDPAREDPSHADR